MHSTNTTLAPDRFAELQRLKADYKAKSDAAKQAKEEMERYQASLFADMRGEDVYGHVSGSHRFDRKSTIYAQVTDRDAFHEWLRQMELDEEFLRDTEEKGRLNELVRDRLDSGEELPPGLGFYAKEYISITEVNRD